MRRADDRVNLPWNIRDVIFTSYSTPLNSSPSFLIRGLPSNFLCLTFCLSVYCLSLLIITLSLLFDIFLIQSFAFWFSLPFKSAYYFCFFDIFLIPPLPLTLDQVVVLVVVYCRRSRVTGSQKSAGGLKKDWVFMFFSLFLISLLDSHFSFPYPPIFI